MAVSWFTVQVLAIITGIPKKIFLPAPAWLASSQPISHSPEY